MFNNVQGSMQCIMVQDVIMIYRIHEQFRFLEVLKSYFSHPKNQFSTPEVFNLKWAL